MPRTYVHQQKKTDFGRGIGIAELLDSSNILALVGGGTFPEFPPNQIVFWNLKTSSKECAMEHKNAVISLKLTHKWVVVGTAEGIYIHNLDNLQLMEKIKVESPPQHISVPKDLSCFVSEGFKNKLYVHTPGSTAKHNKGYMNETVVCSTVSLDGKYYAAASESGKTIQIFDLKSGLKIVSLDRGKSTAAIKSLTISPDNTLIAISSNHATIHIFSTGLGKCKPYEMLMLGYVGYYKIGEVPINSDLYFVQDEKGTLQLISINPDGFKNTYTVKVEGGSKIKVDARPALKLL